MTRPYCCGQCPVYDYTTQAMQISCPLNFQTYIIQPGDTFFRLAVKFETSVDALVQANPGVDPDNLQIGQTICVPLVERPIIAPTRPCPRAWDEYTVQPGDTFYAIAVSRGTTVDILLAYNPGIDPQNLQVGQVLCVPPPGLPPGQIPLPPPCPTGLQPYTIKPGDTIWMLAKQRNTTVDNILRYNPLVDPNNLRVGQIICVP